MAIRSQKDFVAGLMFTVVGVGFALGAQNYDMGSGANMGPGYFPRLLAILLAILGVMVAVKAFGSTRQPGENIGAIAWRPLFFIISANLAFGLLLGGLRPIGLPPMGFALAIVSLVFLASMANKGFKFKEMAILSVILVAGSYLIFVKLLNLPFQMLPGA